jgi:3-methyladenine DNA glycosylase AlkD
MEKLTSTDSILAILRSMESPQNREGMGRFGINVDNALGIKVTDLRKLARKIRHDHDLAGELWETGIHEGRILASMIDIPEDVTESQMDRWANDLDSWDLVDQCCNNLFRKTSYAHGKAVEWSRREEEFIRRAGYTLMAVLAVHDKESPDIVFEGYLSLVEKGSDDDRNFVKKSVNWALRQIGKRNEVLRRKALESAERILEKGSKSARWIARDAMRELGKIRSSVISDQ